MTAAASDAAAPQAPGPQGLGPDTLRALATSPPADRASMAVAGDTYTFVLTGQDTGGRYAVIDMLIPPGGGPAPHRHACLLNGVAPAGLEQLVRAAGWPWSRAGRTGADWALVIDTNLRGTFFGAQAAARRMVPAGGGVIVNIASSLGYHGVPDQASYVTSKFGVRGLTAALAVEWGRHGIRVLAVGPGLTDTASMRGAAGAIDRLDPTPTGADHFTAYGRTSLAGRVGVPDDIARAVAWLASDAAAYVTGSTVLADGGEVASGGAA